MALLEALQSILELLRSSEGSDWAHEKPPEIAAAVEAAIAALQSGDAVDRDRLRLLFAPTGSIQEIAMANGWGDEYLKLSSVLDAPYEEPRR